ncbi:hypothetical protein [uncultured Treponema sp.]|uniref:hypothetical protein n=1 Tax=uncultured Treponema sp. TaxID=162155 RepID=UPI0025987AE0|nr:hypothetical protein [uncultured Treponema sp.]
MSKECKVSFSENQLAIDIEDEKTIYIDCSNDIEINPLVISLTEQIEKNEELEITEVPKSLTDKQNVIVDLVKSIISAFNEVLKETPESDEIDSDF